MSDYGCLRLESVGIAIFICHPLLQSTSVYGVRLPPEYPSVTYRVKALLRGAAVLTAIYSYAIIIIGYNASFGTEPTFSHTK